MGGISRSRHRLARYSALGLGGWRRQSVQRRLHLGRPAERKTTRLGALEHAAATTAGRTTRGARRRRSGALGRSLGLLLVLALDLLLELLVAVLGPGVDLLLLAPGELDLLLLEHRGRGEWGGVMGGWWRRRRMQGARRSS